MQQPQLGDFPGLPARPAILTERPVVEDLLPPRITSFGVFSRETEANVAP